MLAAGDEVDEPNAEPMRAPNADDHRGQTDATCRSLPADDGLSHHGEPEEEEVIVIEEPHEPEVGGPRVVTTPRTTIA